MNAISESNVIHYIGVVRGLGEMAPVNQMWPEVFRELSINLDLRIRAP